jgi:cytochrome c oxidase assembly factor CtaG
VVFASAPSASSWNPAWEEVAALAALAGAYALAARRDRPSPVRIAAFAAGIALALAAVVSPVATISLHYLLAAHLVQNVALAEWVPALLVAGLAPGTAARLASSGIVRALTHPLVALPLWLAAYALWHIPAAYDAAVGHRLLLDLEHLSYLAAGCLLWWPVLQEYPRRIPSGAKAAYLFAAFVLASPLGLILALLPSTIYDAYADAPRLWGLDALTDQQIGGTTMAVSEGVLFFSVFAVFFVRFMAEEDAGYSHGDA